MRMMTSATKALRAKVEPTGQEVIEHRHRSLVPSWLGAWMGAALNAPGCTQYIQTVGYGADELSVCDAGVAVLARQYFLVGDTGHTSDGVFAFEVHHRDALGGSALAADVSCAHAHHESAG